MRITVVIILSCFLSSVEAQKHDTLLAQHTRIIITPKKIKMPQIIDVDFCQKLQAIHIPDSIKVIDDDGQKLCYHLNIEITFSKQGNILSIKPHGTTKAIPGITAQVIKLLKTSEWKTTSSKSGRDIIFECILEDGKFKNVVLTTTNNYQEEKICE
ncbi:MAG TPA: hypothetical protein PKC24_15510 [Cyclobacteriaceae bacterium]|mgnify:CR=1 FL=1|nr:hypothetical protein [Cyclobacteriaceae bacterium]